MIQNERISLLNNCPMNKKGAYVLYWAQSGLRVDNNYALCLAVERANQLNLPLLVFFGVRDDLPFANLRQYHFLKQGLLEFKTRLEDMGGNLLIEKIGGYQQIIEKANRASLIVVDFGYLRSQRDWRRRVAEGINVPMIEVEGDVLCPIRTIKSEKAVFARQLRKKIFEAIPYYARECPLVELKNRTQIVAQSEGDITKLWQGLALDAAVMPAQFIGGEREAERLLDEFVFSKLMFYKEYRSDPSKDYQSNLSPYLHFGFISPVKIVNTILKLFPFADENVQSFFNELLVWRELARNFTFYEKNYDDWQNLPLWAIRTLDDHAIDARKVIYSLKDLELAKTHDPYWNAAQKEMVITGKMHNYMRMYWAKKVIEWTKDWRKAYLWLIYLNDKYELDGRDPNGYAGIAWSFGQFDHPWFERNIFGKVRYMNENGLKRKFDIDLYVKRVDDLSHKLYGAL